MQIHVGFEMVYECPQPTPMIFTLHVLDTRIPDLVGSDNLHSDPPLPRQAVCASAATRWSTTAG